MPALRPGHAAHYRRVLEESAVTAAGGEHGAGLKDGGAEPRRGAEALVGEPEGENHLGADEQAAEAPA